MTAAVESRSAVEVAAAAPGALLGLSAVETVVRAATFASAAEARPSVEVSLGLALEIAGDAAL